MSRQFDQRGAFYVVLLLYRLVCKSRFSAFILFFNPISHTPDATICVFMRSSKKLSNFLITFSILNLLAVRAVSIYFFFYLCFVLSLFLFYALLIFSSSLMLGAAILTILKESTFLTKEVDVCVFLSDSHAHLAEFCISSYRGKEKLRASFSRVLNKLREKHNTDRDNGAK